MFYRIQKLRAIHQIHKLRLLLTPKGVHVEGEVKLLKPVQSLHASTGCQKCCKMLCGSAGSWIASREARVFLCNLTSPLELVSREWNGVGDSEDWAWMGLNGAWERRSREG